MHGTLKLVAVSILLVCSAARCEPIRTSLENTTGEPVKVVVTGKDGTTIAYGEIPFGTGLDLEEPVNSIASVEYAYGEQKCVLASADLEKAKQNERGTQVVQLSKC